MSGTRGMSGRVLELSCTTQAPALLPALALGERGGREEGRGTCRSLRNDNIFFSTIKCALS